MYGFMHENKWHYKEISLALDIYIYIALVSKDILIFFQYVLFIKWLISS